MRRVVVTGLGIVSPLSSTVDGTWTKGEDIVGASATREVRIINTDDLVTPYADNDNIETAADDILDFSQKNPFGDP